MDLRSALLSIHRGLAGRGVAHALIGGLALAAHGAGRATADLDWISDGTRASEVDELLRALGYEPVHRTERVANYASRDPAKGRVDFLFVRRERGTAILRRAVEHEVLGERIPVAEASDLIGLKVQAYANDPRRRNADLADIAKLLLAPSLDRARVREYFRLFDCETDLEELLRGGSER